VGKSLNGVVSADDNQCTITSSTGHQQATVSASSESDYLLMASLQLGALKSLGVLLTSARYMELLLVARDASDDSEKTSSRLDNTRHDDLQVDNSQGSDTRVRTQKNPVGFLGTPT